MRVPPAAMSCPYTVAAAARYPDRIAAASFYGTWLVSDAEDLSTPDLIRRIGVAMGRTVRLLPIPTLLLKGAAMLAGRNGELARLCGSLTVDISQTRNELGWSPPVTVNESLSRTARWYLSRSGSA